VVKAGKPYKSNKKEGKAGRFRGGAPEHKKNPTGIRSLVKRKAGGGVETWLCKGSSSCRDPGEWAKEFSGS